MLRQLGHSSLSLPNLKTATHSWLHKSHFTLLDDLSLLIGSLDEKYKTPLVMYSEGYKYREISDKLGICQGTVKARVFRARKDLRALMDIFF